MTDHDLLMFLFGWTVGRAIFDAVWWVIVYQRLFGLREGPREHS